MRKITGLVLLAVLLPACGGTPSASDSSASVSESSIAVSSPAQLENSQSSVPESSVESDSSTSYELSSQAQSTAPLQSVSASPEAETVGQPDPAKVVLTPDKSVYSLDDEQIIIAMTNQDSFIYRYGPIYELEFWDGSQWIRLERKESMQRNWNHEPGEIEPGESHKNAMDFYLDEYDNLAVGRYRAITHGATGRYGESGGSGPYELTAEFSLE